MFVMTTFWYLKERVAIFKSSTFNSKLYILISLSTTVFCEQLFYALFQFFNAFRVLVKRVYYRLHRAPKYL